MIPDILSMLSVPSGGGVGLEASDGEAFLETLLESLPPEAQGLAMPELLDWLREQAEGASAGLALPPTEAAAPAVLADPNPGQSPVALLSLIRSSRGEAAPVSTEEPPLQAEATPDSEGSLQMLIANNTAVAAAESETMDANAPLRTPVRHPEFGQALGERLTWLVRNEVQQAILRLDPPSLGPLEISIAVKDDQAAILIHANHVVTREVLEAEAPRLRGMLGEAGFAQVDVDVARDNASGDGQDRGGGGPRRLAALGEGEAVDAAPARLRAKSGLIDQYV